MREQKNYISLGALALFAMGIAGPALAESYCANCQLMARQQAQTAVSLGGLESQAHSLLGFASADAQQDRTGFTPNWSRGDLPGSFKAPWHNPETSFDPSFRTPYWSMTDGFTNSPLAPWN
jgi:hypothetical protein